MNTKNLKVGDRIKFKAVTRWSGKAVWRKVNGFYLDTNMPTVTYGGWDNFAVKHREIIEIEPALDSS